MKGEKNNKLGAMLKQQQLKKFHSSFSIRLFLTFGIFSNNNILPSLLFIQLRTPGAVDLFFRPDLFLNTHVHFTGRRRCDTKSLNLELNGKTRRKDEEEKLSTPNKFIRIEMRPESISKELSVLTQQQKKRQQYLTDNPKREVVLIPIFQEKRTN